MDVQRGPPGDANLRPGAGLQPGPPRAAGPGHLCPDFDAAAGRRRAGDAGIHRSRRARLGLVAAEHHVHPAGCHADSLAARQGRRGQPLRGRCGVRPGRRALVEFWWPALAFILAARWYFRSGRSAPLALAAVALLSFWIINRNFWALAAWPLLLLAPRLNLALPRLRWFFYGYYPAPPGRAFGNPRAADAARPHRSLTGTACLSKVLRTAPFLSSVFR